MAALAGPDPQLGLKTCTAETVESNFVMVASMFLDVGLPVVLILDRDTRFTSAFWTGLHAALGA